MSNNWTREQLLIAINLYCQLPFGKFHQGNPLIIATAAKIGRTPSALAMKLSNLASLDPDITGSGRKGLAGASQLDRAIWAEFSANPDQVGYDSQVLVDQWVCPKFCVNRSLPIVLLTDRFGRPTDDASARSAAVRPKRMQCCCASMTAAGQL